MIFYLILAIGIITLIAACFCNWNRVNDTVEIALDFISTVFCCAALILSMIVLLVNTNIDAKIASDQEQYSSLVYQLESGSFNEGNSVARKELYKEIQKWNEDLAYNKKAQYDFWIGPFCPDYYDNFDFIRIEDEVNAELGKK